MKTDLAYKADVAIVGGGIAGCTLAMALAPLYSVVLIDKLPEPVARVGECLAPAARRILRKLDLLGGIVQQPGATLYLPHPGTQSYWGSASRHVVDHLRNPDGPGWHLDRRAFEAYLRKEASERGVLCLWGAKLHSSHYEKGRWQLVTKSADETEEDRIIPVTATFVADAGGRLSAFARQAGVHRTHFDRLVAHWGILPDREEIRMSTISAAAAGWWYSAPVPGNKRVIALHTDPDLVDRRAVKEAGWFINAAKGNLEMAKIVAAADGDVQYCGVVAANSTRLSQVAGKQWAAIGDAAMSFDPLSSQGMFNAMAGALQLSELLLSGERALDHPEHTEYIQAEYGLQMDRIWDRYVQHKHLFYAQEQRWKDATFWQRRC
ncbi:tryptophan 7-halogenase [Taibaiella koreensis]|uniref:tryptophan 7-halogenase n=1 Tax=Taibaiella koreensis TaxID=1268548 RepID=UPI000E59B49E|nr:tryptophan 7-halogenase [Taibaiella koreensis]